MNGTIYMPVGEVCSSISDTYREKKNMVTLINTSDVLEGRVLNHERVPNSNLKGQFKKTFQRDDILYSEIRVRRKLFVGEFFYLFAILNIQNIRLCNRKFVPL